MFKIDLDTLYSINELRENLHGLVEWNTFVDRLALRKKRIFRDAVFGFEILAAARETQAFTELDKPSREVASQLLKTRGMPRQILGKSATKMQNHKSQAVSKLSPNDLEAYSRDSLNS